MFKNFEDFKFEVIDIKKTVGSVKMVINQNGIFFSAGVLDALSRPESVKPLIDMENKVFALQVTKSTMAQSIKVSTAKSKNGGSYTSTCTALRKTIRKLMGDEWKDNMRYEIEGTEFPEAKAVVFELSTAKELPVFATRGGSRAVNE